MELLVRLFTLRSLTLHTGVSFRLCGWLVDSVRPSLAGSPRVLTTKKSRFYGALGVTRKTRNCFMTIVILFESLNYPWSVVKNLFFRQKDDGQSVALVTHVQDWINTTVRGVIYHCLRAFPGLQINTGWAPLQLTQTNPKIHPIFSLPVGDRV